MDLFLRRSIAPILGLLGAVAACTPAAELYDGGAGTSADAGIFLRDAAGWDRTTQGEFDAEGYDPDYPQPGTQSCSVWQDCAPRYDNPNSGYECIESICTCDPEHVYQQDCIGSGAYWINQECFCAEATDPLPSTAPDDPQNCWWSWRDNYYIWCEPDRWVDTSYYEEECYCCDSYGYDICDMVLVEDGYWERGICHYEPYWEIVCY